jgi:excisionase family DNA binding protein
MLLTLGQAAKQVGVSKPTLSKAIASGKLSATRREDGSWAIDPAELHRYLEANQHRFHKVPDEPSRLETQTETAEASLETLPFSVLKPLLDAKSEADRERILREELEKRVELMRGMMDEIKAERDQWRETAQRVLLTSQGQPPAPQPERRGIFGWLKRA